MNICIIKVPYDCGYKDKFLDAGLRCAIQLVAGD